MVEIAAPDKTRVTIDGKDCAADLELPRDGAGHRDCEIIARFSDGSTLMQKMQLRLGRVTALQLRPGAGRTPEMAVQKGHNNYLTSLALSPDGRCVLTGAADCTAILWDAADW